MLPQNKTALVIVDMVNGFASGGPLYSDRIRKLIQPISELQKSAKTSAFP